MIPLLFRYRTRHPTFRSSGCGWVVVYNDDVISTLSCCQFKVANTVSTVPLALARDRFLNSDGSALSADPGSRITWVMPLRNPASKARNENESPRQARDMAGLWLSAGGDFSFTGRFSLVMRNKTPVMPGRQGFSSFASPSREPQRSSDEASCAHDENHGGDDHSGRGADHVRYLGVRLSSVRVAAISALISRLATLLAGGGDDVHGHLYRTLPMRNSGSGSVSSIFSRSENSSQARYPEESSTPQAHPDMLTDGSRMSMRFWYAFVRTLFHEARASDDSTSHAILCRAASVGVREVRLGSAATAIPDRFARAAPRNTSRLFGVRMARSAASDQSHTCCISRSAGK